MKSIWIVPGYRSRRFDVNYLYQFSEPAIATRNRGVLHSSMDVKLPSATGRDTFSLHRAFLEEAPKGTFVKVVLTSRATDAEWRKVLALLKGAPRKVALVIQPATVFGGVAPISPVRALRFEDLARRVVADVRVMPQWHHLWQVR